MPGVVSVSLVMEYAGPYRPVLPRSAVSAEAQVLRVRAEKLTESSEQSFALFRQKALAIAQIWALANECSDAGWDGNGGEPISMIAVKQATDFIRALPTDVPNPE